MEWLKNMDPYESPWGRITDEDIATTMAQIDAEEGIPMQISERYPHLMSVEGWLHDYDAQVTEDLLTYQRSRGLTGDILEIGVYQGRYFILLGKNLAPDETIIGIDIFQSKMPVIPGTAHGDRETCLRHLKKFLPELWDSARLVILEEDSTDFFMSDYARRIGASFRFVSIDGSHDTKTVVLDLLLADHLLVPGGIVALDDWNDLNPPQWPGVRDGWHVYDVAATIFTREPRLHVVWELENKLILTNDETWANDYRTILTDRLEPATV